MKSLKSFMNEMLQDPDIKKLHDINRIMYDITVVILSYRKKHGLTQLQLAEKLGMTQQQLSKIESGANITIETASKVLYELGYALTIVPRNITEEEKKILEDFENGNTKKLNENLEEYIDMAKNI